MNEGSFPPTPPGMAFPPHAGKGGRWKPTPNPPASRFRVPLARFSKGVGSARVGNKVAATSSANQPDIVSLPTRHAGGTRLGGNLVALLQPLPCSTGLEERQSMGVILVSGGISGGFIDVLYGSNYGCLSALFPTLADPTRTLKGHPESRCGRIRSGFPPPAFTSVRRESHARRSWGEGAFIHQPYLKLSCNP